MAVSWDSAHDVTQSSFRNVSTATTCSPVSKGRVVTPSAAEITDYSIAGALGVTSLEAPSTVEQTRQVSSAEVPTSVIIPVTAVVIVLPTTVPPLSWWGVIVLTVSFCNPVLILIAIPVAASVVVALVASDLMCFLDSLRGSSDGG